VFPYKVLIEGLISLGSHLDPTVHKVHLVDEKIAKDSGARNDDIDAGSAKLLQWDELNLVDTSK
jgi:hypothetical protein